MKKIYIILFFCFIGLSNLTAATFTSVSSGTWNAPATWSRVGADTDGIPDSDDDVIVATGHTVILVTLQNDFKTLVINAGGTVNLNSQALNAYGNFTNNGTLVGSFYYFRVFASCTLNSATSITNLGVWWVYANLTISANTVINKAGGINLRNAAIVNNLGSVILRSASSLVFSGTAQWVNGVNSSLNVSAPFAGTINLNCIAAGNTVICNTGCTNVPAANYYNLTLASTTTATKTATGNITVLNNFIMSSGTSNTFNLNNANLTVGGNWSNLANKTILNQGVITFNTATSQTISRTANEVITNMVIGGLGTTVLGVAINARDLTVNSGLLDVSASNFQVNITGNLINNGAINARQGTFNFNGSAAQTISGTQGISFNDLNTGNAAGVSVLSNVAVFYALRVNSGSFGTSGSGIITIPASGPTTYARISTVGGSLFGTGWRIESYIDGPAPAGWQWLSSPINGNVLADWDNDPRFYMSAVNGNDGTALNSDGTGFFYSVRTYNEVSGDYTNITSTSTPLTRGKGFLIWMSDNMTGLTAPLVYNSAGTPNFGTINFPVTAGGAGSGYNLVGNPYACPITYSAVVAASGNLYSSFIILQEDDTYATDPNGGIISPNQGFMCCAFAGGNIVFTEASKAVNGNPNILKSTNHENSITFSVYNNINGIGGRTNINFTENATDNFENGTDLSFLASPSEEADNIYTKSTDQVALLRNMLPNNGEDKDIPLTVKSGVFGSHFISAKGLSDLNLYNSVWLEDLTTRKKVDLLKNREYEFNAEEIGKDYEFIIHFSNVKKSPGDHDIKNSNLLNENTTVYNTPSNVVIKFTMDELTPVNISVYNLAGQKVIETINTNVTDDRIALPLQKENGLYLLMIQSGDEQITRKIIY